MIITLVFPVIGLYLNTIAPKPLSLTLIETGIDKKLSVFAISCGSGHVFEALFVKLLIFVEAFFDAWDVRVIKLVSPDSEFELFGLKVIPGSNFSFL